MINLATGGTRGFTYDAAGNVTAEARPGGTYGYTYTAAGRMSEFLINGVLQASYKYDAMGRQAIRTLTSPTAVTIHSVFDSDGRRIAEYNETSGALIREYVWNGWDPIAVIEGGVISFVRADHIGRPVFATNATGVKVWTATYQPFGGVHTSTGAPPSARFPGQWFQTESGLHQNWMRDYDPTTGRYLQADPLGLIDGASVYGYAGQSPMMNIDPTGQCFGPLIALAPACVGAAVFVIWGWLESDECNPYTWQQAGWDAFNGALFGETAWWAGGAAWKGAGAAWRAWGAGASKPITSIGEKIAAQMTKRGWTKEAIDEAINNPVRTVATRDTRFTAEGTRMDDPATAFYGKNGGYVVRNDRTGDIVQVSDVGKPGWKAPWD